MSRAASEAAVPVAARHSKFIIIIIVIIVK